jgi:hypothetical protein
MIVELKLQRWIWLGLHRHAADPTLVRTVFYDDSQDGLPSDLGDGFLEDTAQRWLPSEYAPIPLGGDAVARGAVLYGGLAYPIVDNTEDRLLVEGDLTLAVDTDDLGYAIIPPEVPALSAYLRAHIDGPGKFLVETAFARIPSRMPAFTIRLERDAQTDAYFGDRAEHRLLLDGTEEFVTRRDIQGQHLVSIWTQNRDACLWLYTWLVHWFLGEQDRLARWGLIETSLTGSDIDPLIQFLPSDVFVRHALLVATRQERALVTKTPPPLTGMGIDLTLLYQTINVAWPLPLP